MKTCSGDSSVITCSVWKTASADPLNQLLPVRCCAGIVSMKLSSIGDRRHDRAMCSSSDALLYCVNTLIFVSPELTKFDRTMSMIR